MLVLMHQDATPEQIRDVTMKIGELGFLAHEIPGAERVAIGITGNHGAITRTVWLALVCRHWFRKPSASWPA